jgi:GNAT superfamily N-acetyltransferase
MSAIMIRDAVPADVDAVAELIGVLGYPTSPDLIRDRMSHATGGGGRVIVAESAGRVTGVITIFHIRTLHRPGDICRITALVVAESERGTGVGRQLVDEVERHARASGCVRVEVTSAAGRSGAHAFYERLGYTDYPKRFIKDL